MGPDEVDDLAERLLAADRAAVSPALNLVDDRRPAMRDAALYLLDRLHHTAHTDDARRVGFTGAPGAGKSTLLDALIRVLREKGQSVGIIAVDPSSQRSGGALLGDRFRMRSGAADPGVFVRSMAARDRLGGLADAAQAGVAILSAVFDWVCVETVGVGQSESDVAALVDTLVFVAQPAAGDVLQYMKAGLIELPDVFVVNKSDMGPAADRTEAELAAGLGLGESTGSSWQAPVLLASARDGQGIDAIVQAVEAHRRHLNETGEFTTHRRAASVRCARGALERRYGSYGIERWGGGDALEERLERDSNAAQQPSPFSLVRTLSLEIESALREASA